MNLSIVSHFKGCLDTPANFFQPVTSPQKVDYICNKQKNPHGGGCKGFLEPVGLHGFLTHFIRKPGPSQRPLGETPVGVSFPLGALVPLPPGEPFAQAVPLPPGVWTKVPLGEPWDDTAHRGPY